MKIDFLNLKKLNKKYETVFLKKTQQFFESGNYILGNEVSRFESDFANYCGVKHCIGVSSGLDALTLILKGYIELGRLDKGDVILVASNTYIATIIAIINAGLKPVLIEPCNKTFNLDPRLLNVKQNPKAVLVTYLYGQLAEIEKIKIFCKENNLLLISDSAQAHGAEDLNCNKAGSLADASGFSFYPTKNLGALGDAGAITTSDDRLNEVLLALRNYGSIKKNEHQLIGVNSRLDEIQAAFLNVKLPYLDNENENRRAIARRYIEEIKNIKIDLPIWDESNNHVFHQFVIRVSDRNNFQKYMNENGIGTLIHYPVPPHKQKALKGFFTNEYPITEKLCNEIISLPISLVLTKTQVDYIIKIINTY